MNTNNHESERESIRVDSRSFADKILCGVFVGLLALALPSNAETEIQFNRDARPIFSDKCFHCHGPDKSKRKADLRLDLHESALGKSESGKTAIVPATILRQMGIDHTKLTFKFQGRHFRLTDVHGQVVKGILA